MQSSIATARLVHLFGIGNLVFAPFGLIAAFVILTRNAHDPIVRENARAALNVQLTWLIFAVLVLVVSYLTLLGHGAVLRAEDVASGRLLTMKRYWFSLGTYALIVVSEIVTIVFNVVAAVAAGHARVYRYPIAFAFSKPRAITRG